MGAGFKGWNPSGALAFDLGSRLGGWIAYASINAAGNATHESFGAGEFIWAFYPRGGSRSMPVVYRIGNTVYWQNGQDGSFNGTLFWGVR